MIFSPFYYIIYIESELIEMDYKIYASILEDEARTQIEKMASSPIGENAHIRIMPDAHAGKGCVIGTTMRVRDKVCPNLVGVDIGCGVSAFEVPSYNRFTKEELKELLSWLEDGGVPSGRNVWEKIEDIDKATNRLDISYSWFGSNYIDQLYCKNKLQNIDYLNRSIGTLGGGNHFISIEESSSGIQYLLIHSGSRNLGVQVAQYYQNLAEQTLTNEYNEKRAKKIAYWKEKDPTQIQKALFIIGKKPASGLEFITNDLMEDYLHDMDICTLWARWNRLIIATIIMTHCNKAVISSIDTPHNYIDIYQDILRKGAVDASMGLRFLLPLNMRDGTLICKGKGNEDWNCSAPHGAGRLMSRAQARATIDFSAFQKSMEGIVSNTCIDTIDEAPFAYKDWEIIAEAIEPTATILDHLHPIFNFKAQS